MSELYYLGHAPADLVTKVSVTHTYAASQICEISFAKHWMHSVLHDIVLHKVYKGQLTTPWAYVAHAYSVLTSPASKRCSVFCSQHLTTLQLHPVHGYLAASMLIYTVHP